jgi:signal transduction histidine kinase
VTSGQPGPASGSMGAVPTVARWWGSRSNTQRLDLYTRWSFYTFIGALPLFAFAVLGSATEPVSPWPVGLFLAGCLATGVAAVVVTRQGLAAHVRGDPLPSRTVLAAFAVAGATAAVGGWAFSAGPAGPAVPWAVGLPLTVVLTACSTAWPTRQLAPHSVTVGVLAGFASWLTGNSAVGAVFTAISLALVAFGVVLAFRFSVWVLDVVQQMERSRGIELQLAVAEERLRFARDLHDVMGRNLSTIAVKSQLAGELVRRGRPGADEEVADISRIAEASLREVREVVRGYRTADLPGELAGARSVLRAAGVACTVTGEDAGAALAGEVQAALGWVVREAVTNVLRHSRAAECGITLTVADGEVRLDVANDGAGDGPVVRGNGLTGLAERLAGAGGRLDVAAAGGRFRLTATVPLAVPR